MKNHEIMTIGYEGANINDFIETLVKAEINTLIDIRERPLSRKKGFSKTKLSEALMNNGINYIHLKGLGDPKEGREAAKQKHYNEFFRVFENHMISDEAQADLSSAITIASSTRACFLCFERNHKYCHRNIVVQKIIEKTGQNVVHIGVRENLSSTMDVK